MASSKRASRRRKIAAERRRQEMRRQRRNSVFGRYYGNRLDDAIKTGEMVDAAAFGGKFWLSEEVTPSWDC